VNESRPHNPPKLRRSWRLSKKNQPVTVSGYFYKLATEQGGKSVFKEIKTKYVRKFVEGPLDDDFGTELFDQLKNFTLRDSATYKKKISEEIDVINGILTGKNTRNMSINPKRNYKEEDKENCPMKFPYIPQSNWVFQTPPNRKLNYHHVTVDENCMKPAVIETQNDGKVVYEMNNKINIDLSQYGNKQQIDIDKRYMMEVSSSSYEDQNESEAEEKCTFRQSDPFELENHFLSLTCRPKKLPTALPKYTAMKRKRDIFEPQPGCSTELDDFKPKFSFLNSLPDLEESFTFKFTSSECRGGSTTGHLFDFGGNKKDTFNFCFD
jgi:hypothetical protein